MSNGLHRKYDVFRAGEVQQAPYPVFVLRIDGTDPTAMVALEAYADYTDDTLLQLELRDLIMKACKEEENEETWE